MNDFETDGFLETIMQTSRDGVFMVNLDGHILKANDVAKRLFEQKDDITSHFIWTLSSLDNEQQTLKDFFERIIKTQPKPQPYFGNLHKNKNEEMPVKINWNYAWGKKGKLNGLVFVVEGISEEISQNVRPTIIEQVQYSRLATIEEVVARISHELNQPLSAIINYSGGSLKRLEKEYSTSDLMHAMKMILRQAERVGDVIERMKMFLKKGELRKETLNINQVIKEVLACMRPELQSMDVQVNLELGNMLPAVTVDKVQFEQVLLNIIQNALESMRDIDVMARSVTLKTYLDGEQKMAVSIADTGHGIKPDDLEKIFESFYTTKTTGMGIGLAISQSIMTAHGGSIHVTSERGKGTTFILIIDAAGI